MPKVQPCDVQEVWREFKAGQTEELRNVLMDVTWLCLLHLDSSVIIFFILGMVLGYAGHLAITEHTRSRAKMLRAELEKAREGPGVAEEAVEAEASTATQASA